MTAPPPALILIDQQALEVAKAEAHKVWLTLDDYVEAAIRAYLAASGLPGVVVALERVLTAPWGDQAAACGAGHRALAKLNGGGDAG